VGGRDLGGEQHEVVAAGEAGEAADDGEGVQGDVGVGLGEDRDGLAEGGAALLEAGHAAVEEGVGGLAAAMGLTGFAVGELPVVGVAAELVADARPDLAGEGGAGGGHGPGGGGLLGGAPDLGDAGDAAAAGVAGAALGVRGPEAAEAGGEDRGEDRGEGEAAAGAGAAAIEGSHHRGHRREAQLGVGLEAALQDGEQPAGDAGAAGWRPQLSEGDRLGDLGDGLAGEGELGVEALVERGAEAELIGGGAGDAAADELLGRHVSRGADDLLALGVAQVAGVAGVGAVGGVAVAALGGTAGEAEAEVEHAHAAVVAEHRVARLEVAMHEAGGVGRREAARGLHEHLDDLAPGAGLVLEPGLQGDAADQLHGDEDVAVVGADLVDDGDVGVGDAGHRLGLAEQAGVGAGGPGPARCAQELDGDPAVELGVDGGVHDAHRADAEALQQGEATDAVTGGQEVALAWRPGAGAVGLGAAARGDDRDGPRHRGPRAAGDRPADLGAHAEQVGLVEAVAGDVGPQLGLAIEGQRAGEVREQLVPQLARQRLEGAGVGGRPAQPQTRATDPPLRGERQGPLARVSAAQRPDGGDVAGLGQGGEQFGEPLRREEGAVAVQHAGAGVAVAHQLGDEEADPDRVAVDRVGAAGAGGGADEALGGVRRVLVREQARGQIDPVQIEVCQVGLAARGALS
jgi:hypothetical protein